MDIADQLKRLGREKRNRQKLAVTGEQKVPPKHLEEVFKDRRELLIAVDALTIGFDTIKLWDFEGLAYDVDCQKVRDLIFQTIQEIYQGLPYKPCVCKAFEDCELCGGRRWLSLRQADMLEQTLMDNLTANASPDTSS